MFGVSIPLLAVIAGILGLILGSFVGALSYRLPRGGNVAKGRSACTACGAALGPRDLVPVLSWLFQGGRCRYCGVGISARYPVIEITTAILFAAAAFLVEDVIKFALVLAMTPIMVALAVIDLEHHRLPNTLIIPLGIISLGYRYVIDADFITASITASVVLALAIFIDHLGRRTVRQGLGMGDAKLMAIVAIALPVPFTLSVLAASGILGVFTGVVSPERHRHGGHFPFGPAILASFWGGLVFL